MSVVRSGFDDISAADTAVAHVAGSIPVSVCHDSRASRRRASFSRSSSFIAARLSRTCCSKCSFSDKASPPQTVPSSAYAAPANAFDAKPVANPSSANTMPPTAKKPSTPRTHFGRINRGSSRSICREMLTRRCSSSTIRECTRSISGSWVLIVETVLRDRNRRSGTRSTLLRSVQGVLETDAAQLLGCRVKFCRLLLAKLR